MPAADLSPEIWAVIGLIAGLAVTMCLAVLASLHGHLVKARKLADDVKARHSAYRSAFTVAEFVEGPVETPPGDVVTGGSARKAA